jgi:hypothetical protein
VRLVPEGALLDRHLPWGLRLLAPVWFDQWLVRWHWPEGGVMKKWRYWSRADSKLHMDPNLTTTPAERKDQRLSRLALQESSRRGQDLKLIGDGAPKANGKHNKTQILRAKRYRKQANRRKRKAAARAEYLATTGETQCD